MTNTPQTQENVQEFKIFKFFVPVLIIISIAVASLYLVKYLALKKSSQGQYTEIGQTVPDFALKQFLGEETLFSKVKSKVTMINFWATWCESCMIEMPSIVALHEKFKDQGFALILVNLDEVPEKVVPGALTQFKIRFPVYLDQDNALSNMFEVHAIPLTLFIGGAENKILYYEPGERDWNAGEVHDQIKIWLSES